MGSGRGDTACHLFVVASGCFYADPGQIWDNRRNSHKEKWNEPCGNLFFVFGFDGNTLSLPQMDAWGGGRKDKYSSAGVVKPEDVRTEGRPAEKKEDERLFQTFGPKGRGALLVHYRGRILFVTAVHSGYRRWHACLVGCPACSEFLLRFGVCRQASSVVMVRRRGAFSFYAHRFSFLRLRC